MAIYYVRTDGSNSNAGTGPATNQAWQTVTYALANMVLTNGTNYLYIAPGVYRGSATLSITPSSTQTLVISGDPTAAQFTGVASGIVRVTNFTSDTSNPTNSTLLTISGKTYTTIQNIAFDFYSTSTSFFCINAQSNCDYIAINNCVFNCHDGGGAGWSAAAIRIGTSTTINSFTIDKCLYTNAWLGVYFTSTAASSTTQNISVTRCQFFGGDYDVLFDGNGLGRTVYNCTHCFNDRQAITSSTAQTGSTSVYNCLFYRGNAALTGPGMVENYNRFISTIPRTNVSPSGANSVTGGVVGLDFGYSLLTGIANQQMVSSITGGPNISFGTSSGAPVSDLYGVTWNNSVPDAGAATYRSLSSVGSYIPTERNASTITIAPGSTSQSIELYLGATGLTASTAGLSARYNRTRTASVNIPLVARTIGQAWISGGFAEVDAVNMPGIYRVDIPDAALAVGADDVTLVVRGASGTNGAVMTIKLSSGGLTSAETASAVWGASVAGYVTGTDFGGVINETRNVVGATETYVLDVPNQVWEELTVNHDTHGTYGWNVLRADAPSKEGLVTLHQSGGVSRVDADIHAIVNDADAASELKGALLHNGTDYISANLLTPTSPATLLRMGPYSVVADQAKQEINIDILTGSSLPIVLQLVDVTGTGIPLVGATLSVKIYNASGTLVTTYTGTASYSDAGFLTFTLDSVVTANPGTYYLTVTRTTGATDTSIYGGLRLYVRSN